MSNKAKRIANHSVHDLGNSLGITLPSKWIQKHEIKPKDKLRIYEKDNNIIIRPPKK